MDTRAELERPPRRARRASRELGGSRCRSGCPLARLGVAGDGLRVEQERGQLDRGYPVDHAVMSLADDSDSAVLEPIGDRDLPQGTVARKRFGQGLVEDLPEPRG